MIKQFVMVDVAASRRLIPLTEIREIVAMVELTGQDAVKGQCRGLFNLRGEAVPVFEVSSHRGELSPSRFILISELGQSPVGLIVDDVLGVISVDEDRVATRPIELGKTIDCAEVGGEILTIFHPKEIARS